MKKYTAQRLLARTEIEENRNPRELLERTLGQMVADIVREGDLSEPMDGDYLRVRIVLEPYDFPNEGEKTIP